MTDPLAAEARRLRVVEQLSVRDIRARLGVGRNRVHELLRGFRPRSGPGAPTPRTGCAPRRWRSGLKVGR
ncbi:hypothetical protein [Micromonospora sp. IBHARD004]|uniref:hypothetical protein n=1 Tax=Micromonospora sp. IBHARD004 TaxID=3457764 RepID=UPI0040594AA3